MGEMLNCVRTRSRGVIASALCLVVAVFASGCVNMQPAPAPDGGVPARAGDPSAIEAEIIRFTNEVRARNGLQPLRTNGALLVAARLHVVQMVEHQMLSHTLPRARYPTLEDRLKASGYPWLLSAENIAWNEQTPQTVVNAWMRSPAHRVNIMSAQFTDIGTAMKRNSRGEPYWIQVFGKPR